MNSFLIRNTQRIILLIFIVSFTVSDITSAQTLKEFSQKISMWADGKANVELNFIIVKENKDKILVPWSFTKPDSAGVSFNVFLNHKQLKSLKDSSGNKYYPVEFITMEGTDFLELNVSSFDDFDTITIKFTVSDFFNIKKTKIESFGNYTLKNKFVNTTSTLLKDFSSEIILPQGYDITSVDESIPKQENNDPISPYSISRKGELNSVILKSSGLKLGDNTFIKFRFKQEKKSPFILIILSVTGILYLLFFRDLIRPISTNKENANNVKG